MSAAHELKYAATTSSGAFADLRLGSRRGRTHDTRKHQGGGQRCDGQGSLHFSTPPYGTHHDGYYIVQEAFMAATLRSLERPWRGIPYESSQS